jgi:hypothetical protein
VLFGDGAAVAERTAIEARWQLQCRKVSDVKVVVCSKLRKLVGQRHLTCDEAAAGFRNAVAVSHPQQVKVVGFEEGVWIVRLAYQGLDIHLDQKRSVSPAADWNVGIASRHDRFSAAKARRAPRSGQFILVCVPFVSHPEQFGS